MLEILVDLERVGNGEIGGASKPEKQVGDIIAVRIAPAKDIWGKEEKRLFLITYLDDPQLEKTLKEENKTLIGLPYSLYSENVLINRSIYKVNIGMFKGSLGLNPKDITEPVGPTIKTGFKMYCPHCNKIFFKLTRRSLKCKKCENELVDFLRKENLILDKSNRILYGNG